MNHRPVCKNWKYKILRRKVTSDQKKKEKDKLDFKQIKNFVLPR